MISNFALISKQRALSLTATVLGARSVLYFGPDRQPIVEALPAECEIQAYETGASALDSFTPDFVVCFDVLQHIASPPEYHAMIEELTKYGVPLVVSGLDFPPMLSTPGINFHESLLLSLDRRNFVPIPLAAYSGLVVFVALPTAASTAVRDITAATLKVAVEVVDDRDLLFEAIARSRSRLGFFPDHLPRCIEYPWIVQNLPKPGPLRIVDAGAGVSILPMMLADRGHHVVTVDSHPLQRSIETRDSWNEWGYLDYSALDPRIRSFNVRYQDLSDSFQIDAFVSVSVIEHLPREVRKVWIRKAYEQIVPGGSILLTVDTEPFSRSLWNFSEGVQVDEAAWHGTVDDLKAELLEVGFELDSLECQEWLPTTKVGMARYKAHKSA